MSRSMKVIIDPQGKAKIDVAGTKGMECEELTRSLRAGLGVVENVSQTCEFHQSAEASVEQTIQE